MRNDEKNQDGCVEAFTAATEWHFLPATSHFHPFFKVWKFGNTETPDICSNCWWVFLYSNIVYL